MKMFSLRCFQKEEQLERGEAEIEEERDRERERQNNSSRQKKNKRISKDSRHYFGFIMYVLVPILFLFFLENDFFFLESDSFFFFSRIGNYSKLLFFI